MHELHSLILTGISGIAIVALQQGEHAWAQKIRILPELRTGRVAQHAVDAIAEILEPRHFCRRL